MKVVYEFCYYNECNDINKHSHKTDAILKTMRQ